MSNKEQDRVWEQSQMKGTGLVVMLAIANRANENGICWPGLDDLAKRARASEKSVRRLIDAAVKAGELAIKKRPGKSHIYAILIGLSRDEKYGRLAFMHAAAGTKSDENIELHSGQFDRATPDNLTALPRTECPPTPDNLTGSGRQTPAQTGTPVGTVYAQNGRRTIIEPSIEYSIYDLYLSVFAEPPISKEHDLLGELQQVYKRDDIREAMAITKERHTEKRITHKIAYMRGILQDWARNGKPEDSDDDDGPLPIFSFGHRVVGAERFCPNV